MGLLFHGLVLSAAKVPVPVKAYGHIALPARLLVSGPPPVSLLVYPGNRRVPASMEDDILRYVNLHRDSMGLKPLQMNAVESGIAEKHSREMASGKTPFGHQGIDQRIKAIGKQLGPVMAAGENVAYGQTTAREVVNEWLHSPGHRKNIEGDYTLTGIGLANDSKGIPYYTQIFTK